MLTADPRMSKAKLSCASEFNNVLSPCVKKLVSCCTVLRSVHCVLVNPAFVAYMTLFTCELGPPSDHHCNDLHRVEFERSHTSIIEWLAAILLALLVGRSHD